MVPMGFTRNATLFYNLTLGDSGIYTAAMDPMSGKLHAGEKITEPFSGGNMSPDWSPDGKTLVIWGTDRDTKSGD